MKNPLFILLALILSGCYTIRPPRRVQNIFNYEQTNDYRLCGIYKSIDTSDWTNYFVFYEDGTVVSGINESYFKRYNINGGIKEFLNKAEEDSIIRNLYLRMLDWGYYTIKNDTLTINQVRGRQKVSVYWDIISSAYTLSEGNRIELISSKWIDAFKDDNYKIYSSAFTAYFVDTFDCSESNTWLKYQDWFWNKEADYQNWMKNKTGIDISTDKKAMKRIQTP